MARRILTVVAGALLFASCTGGSSGTPGAFSLVQFLEGGQANIPRNRTLTFEFTSDVGIAQDFAERLKVENVQQSAGASNFSRAIGAYVVTGNIVTFRPQLPEERDRSDAGFRGTGNYVVFLKAGPDALRASSGDTIVSQQELSFQTNEFFEDPVPGQPPRALRLLARDPTTGDEIDISRIDPQPGELALRDSGDLIAAGRIIDPGAGGQANDFSTPWNFELVMSEPVDPATVTERSVLMFEIFDNATESDDQSPPAASDGHFGDPVNFAVPINVEVVQGLNAAGVLEVRIRIIPLFTLVDNARYRIIFRGTILGIDFRNTFVGDNGLTGDGQTQLAGAGPIFNEVGGLGYTAEILVQNLPTISATRVLSYDPLTDGVRPETGQTTGDETRFNNALYNAVGSESLSVGLLAGFGTGSDGALAAGGGQTVIVDTGDTPNIPLGNDFTVNDINPDDEYNGDTRPGGPLSYDSVEPFEFNAETVVISGSSTLQVIGVNPFVLRVRGIAQIDGTIDISGADGQQGGGANSTGGAAGAGGFAGGSSKRGPGVCGTRPPNCSDFQLYLDQCTLAGNAWPFSLNGQGPGRGQAGGSEVTRPSVSSAGANNEAPAASGGGGASHATLGAVGQDNSNIGEAPGTGGMCVLSFANTRLSGVIDVRGTPGPIYGDRTVVDVTLGGSGGGAGGSASTLNNFQPGPQAGGGGGGGGGTITIVSAGGISVQGGVIDASGGDGGRGNVVQWNNNMNNNVTAGGGGAGSGGNIVLISGDDINLAAALLDATGGTGGAAGGTAINCSNCNAGGDGGNGFIFLMDADGLMTGLVPSVPGEYDTFASGLLTISEFNADRFGDIQSVTELFNVFAADPTYTDLAPVDLLANVADGQSIDIFVSSAKADPDDPLLADPTSEIAEFQVAQVVFGGGGGVAVNIVQSMAGLNPGGAPARDAFIRVRALFNYTNGVESALGPFAAMDQIVVGFDFN